MCRYFELNDKGCLHMCTGENILDFVESLPEKIGKYTELTPKGNTLFQVVNVKSSIRQKHKYFKSDQQKGFSQIREVSRYKTNDKYLKQANTKYKQTRFGETENISKVY